MCVAGEDLKVEEEDDNFGDYSNDCDPIDLNSKFVFTQCYFNPITL